MVRFAAIVVFVGACSAPSAAPVEAGAPEVPSSRPIALDAVVDLTELQTALSRRVDASDRSAAPLRARALRLRGQDVVTALGEVDVTAAAAKLQMATLETPAASAAAARTSVESYENAVAALAAALVAR